MKLNIQLDGKTQEMCLADLAEVFADSKITLLNNYNNKIIDVEVVEKDGNPCVYPLEALNELSAYYGYYIRLW